MKTRLRLTHILLFGLLIFTTACQAPTANPAAAQTPSPLPDTPTPSPIPEMVATVIAGRPPAVKDESISPDRRWRSQVLRYECILVNDNEEMVNEEMAYEVLRLFDTAQGTQHEIADQLQACGGLGAAGLEVITWSRSSRFLYFTDASQGVPDGGSGYWERPMFAYNLETEEKTELGKGKLAPDRGVIAIWLLDRERSEYELVLWDLEQGEIARFQSVEKTWYRGPIVWSPDGKRLAFLESQEWYAPGGETLLELLDPENGEVNILLRSADHGFVGLEWVDQDRLKLTDQNQGTFIFNVSTKELIQQP